MLARESMTRGQKPGFAALTGWGNFPMYAPKFPGA